jgi:hypothetical protein
LNQVIVIRKAFSMNSVSAFSTGQANCEPAVLNDYCDVSNRARVTWSGGQNVLDFLSGQLCIGDVGRRNPPERAALFGRRRRIGSLLKRVATFEAQIFVDLTRISACSCCDFCR